MLLPSFFVVDISQYNRLPDVQLSENTYLSFGITDANLDLVDRFYKEFFSFREQHRFCLLINLKGKLKISPAELESILDFLVSFSFHSNYIKASHDNPLVLFEMDEGKEQNVVTITRQAFTSHGYNDIETLTIPHSGKVDLNSGRKNVRFDLQANVNGIFSEYMRAIQQLTSSQSSLFFFLNNPENLPEVLATIEKAESMIEQQLPQTYYLLQENTSLIAKKQELLFETELLHQQLDSFNNYHFYYELSDSRYKRQITELLRFYKNEYEILPTWYKRFGHIIKVLTGKRTFRSLFDDNVKKYKD